MRFLEVLYLNEEVATLASFGIEDKHYELIDERVSLIPESGYRYPGVWIVTSILGPKLMVGEAEDKVEQYDEFNQNAEISCTAGFYFDESNVAAEITAVDAVFDEYRKLMEHGFYDPDEYLPILHDRLASAGIDKIIAEMQTQYDAFLAGN